jgi:hypothetical protein
MNAKQFLVIGLAFLLVLLGALYGVDRLSYALKPEAPTQVEAAQMKRLFGNAGLTYSSDSTYLVLMWNSNKEESASALLRLHSLVETLHTKGLISISVTADEAGVVERYMSTNMINKSPALKQVVSGEALISYLQNFAPRADSLAKSLPAHLFIRKGRVRYYLASAADQAYAELMARYAPAAPVRRPNIDSTAGKGAGVGAGDSSGNQVRAAMRNQ